MKKLTATLSDLFVHDGTLYAIATFSDRHNCRVRFAPPSAGEPGNGAELYRRAGKWSSGEPKWELVDFGNANEARLAAVVAAASPIYTAEVEKDRLDRLEVEAENERRLDLVRALHAQCDAGPLLYEVLSRIAATADIEELLDDEPTLRWDLAVALAAAKGKTVDDDPLPRFNYRPTGADYFSGVSVSAPDEEAARRLATAQMHDGRDRFGATRRYLPEEVEVRLA